MSRLSVLIHLTLGILLAAQTSTAQNISFERDVLPIFTGNCLSCHGGTSIYTQAGLDLRTINSVLRGSLNGQVIVKGSPDKSLLYQKVSARVMPPAAFKLTLTDTQIETIRKWIEIGAPSEKTAEKSEPDEELTRFERQALPILSAKCISCHGAGTPMASLDLRTLDSVLKGGVTGPVVMEGASEKSMLIRNILSNKMPPPRTNAGVTPAELETLRQWIDKARFTARPQVASLRETFTPAEAPEVTEKDRQYWAFRRPVAQPVPKVRNQQRVRTPIDAFVLAKLEAEGLGLSAEASSQTLMRRAYMDLTGLPPTPEEIKAFTADTKPGAYERLVDGLLASPQYGERWGRHWLDATGYTDVTGADIFLDTIEVHEGMWRYRDYVVRSFNEDKPYDRFLTEQLAGDELVDWRNANKFTPQVLDCLTATGYLRSVYDHTDADIVNLPHERYEVLFHVAEKVSSSLLGLTVGCARCHSHKYDPIPQRDYYRFLSIFAPAYNPWNWTQPKNRVLATVSPMDEEEIKRHNADLDKPIAERQKELDTLLKPYQERLLDAKLQNLPAEIRAETKAALDTAADKQDDVQKFLVKKFGEGLKVVPEEVDKALKDADKLAKAKIDGQIKTLNGYRRPLEKIQVLLDVGLPSTMRLLQRGNVETPGPKVQPGVLTVLSDPGKSDLVRPPDTQGKSSGFRLAFAQWLTSRDHPLTARVVVNRIWQQHFGRGIVETPDNFGKLGTAPTHPELLDWLAVDFMQQGWKLKRLHRLIMTSSVYRQFSHQPQEDQRSLAKELDPENHLLWRMNLLRLEAEVIRDAVLAASGKLDRTSGGPAIMLAPRPEGLQTVSEKDPTPNAKYRRSLYLLARRNYPLEFLQVFDFPVIQVNCTRRINSATPLQSLTMLNDEFMVENGNSLAQRVMATAREQTPSKWIETAYLLALSRKPTSSELKICTENLEKQKELYLHANTEPKQAERAALGIVCHMLMGTNEFLFVD
jgi:mono/diheme cytochrome c family protein